MITSYSTKRTQIQHESSSHVEINLQNYAIEDERRDDTFSTDEELSEEQDATQTVPSGSSNNEDDGNDSGSSSDRYEEDVEEQTLVEARRRKLPKSKVDDKFFNLAEMEAFVCAQDKEEEERQQKMGRNLGQFDMAEEMDSIIRSYEEENLKSRSWALQGEAMADERRKDELLEQFMDVDYRAAVPPTISMEKTAHLEALIKKRIKEKLFDDAVRKYRENEALIPIYRNETAIEQNVRKSLAEVYEEKFAEELNKQDDAVSQQAKPELDPTVAAIQRDMDELFLQLDALSHFQFRPRPVREEVKIVNNMPSLNAEEVGPTASAEPDANLLAPEEIMRHAKSAPKAADERNETDRKRERRHKKRKQRVLASIGAMGGKKGKKVESKEDINLMDKRGLLKRARIGGGTGKKLNFAAEMHQLMAEGSDGPAERKRRRNKGKKTENPRKKIFTLAS